MTNTLEKTLSELPNIIRIVIFMFFLGVAWATLGAAVSQKADKTEVLNLQTEIHSMSKDIKTIRNILCKQASADSFCGNTQ